MRKHKSVVAILLAVMMIFTFMPTMAFAQPDYTGYTTTWAKDYKSVTVTNDSTKESATFTNVKYAWSDGVVIAYLDWSTVDPSAVPELGEKAEPEWYYDLNNSYVARYAKDSVNTFAYSTFEDDVYTDYETKLLVNDDFGVILVQPDYTDGYTTAQNAQHIAMTNTAYASKVEGDDFAYVDGFKENSYADMEVTLTASPVEAYHGTHTEKVNFVGTVPSKQIIVKGMIPEPDQFDFNIDDIEEGSKTGNWNYRPGRDYEDFDFTIYGNYDGMAHKVVNSEVPGYSVSYEVQDLKTKKWNPVDVVEFKDAGHTYVRVTVLKDGKPVTGATFIGLINVRQVKNNNDVYDEYGFDSSVATTDASKYVEVASDVDPIDFITTKTADGVILDADKDEAIKFFKAAYDVVRTPNKADSSKEVWTIKRNDAKFADLAKEFETFVNNYGITGASDRNTSTAQVRLVVAPTPADQTDDVTFTKAQGQSWTAKQMKKKARSFKVKAEADSGKTVKYYIVSSNTKKITINNTTGKVTVKKGLKSGTYTVVIKAKTVAGDGYKAASEKATIKVKVTKK